MTPQSAGAFVASTGLVSGTGLMLVVLWRLRTLVIGAG
jgi:hypothetical protein